MARIALDAMGGDFAPQATVAGALLALSELDPAHSIQLVGRSPVIAEQLDGLFKDPEYAPLKGLRGRLSTVEAADVIEMTDKPAAAVRGKPNSSMLVGLRLQSEGESDAFVSAGNTGAQMAASMLALRLHAGLKRPAIATHFPTARKPVVVLDSGANVDCRAERLEQYAIMGSAYAQKVLHIANPRVALLSVGEERTKGNALVLEAAALLEVAPINFTGNVEGKDMVRNDADVIVADGFVGNVALKTSEGVANLVRATLKETLAATITRQVGY
ncbi:MAG: phosphate acyltransferase PlsX, partial [Terriglobia bacterium]